MGCQFRVKVRCSQNGQVLFIKAIENDHNHEISEVSVGFVLIEIH